MRRDFSGFSWPVLCVCARSVIFSRSARNRPKLWFLSVLAVSGLSLAVGASGQGGPRGSTGEASGWGRIDSEGPRLAPGWPETGPRPRRLGQGRDRDRRPRESPGWASSWPEDRQGPEAGPGHSWPRRGPRIDSQPAKRIDRPEAVAVSRPEDRPRRIDRKTGGTGRGPRPRGRLGPMLASIAGLLGPSGPRIDRQARQLRASSWPLAVAGWLQDRQTGPGWG